MGRSVTAAGLALLVLPALYVENVVAQDRFRGPSNTCTAVGETESDCVQGELCVADGFGTGGPQYTCTDVDEVNTRVAFNLSQLPPDSAHHCSARSIMS